MTSASDMLKPLVDAITTEQYIRICLHYNKENNESLIGIPYEYCPVNLFASLKRIRPCREVTPGLTECPICGHSMCSACHNHNTEQISRVTGYTGAVSGWNNAKKQELKDRRRYKIHGQM